MNSIRSTLAIASLGAALALVGCGGGGGYGGGPPPAPVLSLSATTVTFPAQATGTTSTAQVLTVSNTGNATLTISGVSIGGVDALAFAETSTCASVMAGSSCTVSITYTPSALGNASATLDITANVSGSPVGVMLSGTGSAATGGNTVAGVVDAGPTGVSAINLLYVSVTVCAPGGTPCQVIDHVQVDTGSYGLRILSEVLNAPLAMALTTRTSGAGHALLECTQFADGYSWGPIKTADVTIGGESVTALPIQVIGDPAYPSTTVPAACKSGPGGPNEEDTVLNFGANGILGIGYFLEDCGALCPADGTVYSDCNGTTCTGYAALLTEQMPNPVGKFAVNNTGVIIQLPDVAGTGGTDVAGTLIFGIGTAGNNALGSSATVYTVSATQGSFTAKYAGTTLPDSFVDSGSNAYYFPNVNSALTLCTAPNDTFYCPTPDTTVMAQITGANNVMASLTVPVNNLSELGNSTTAFPGLAGTITGLPTTFDFGLPFFFGRTVYVAFEGTMLGGQAAPAIAF